MENQKELLRALPKVDECLLWLKDEKRKDLPSRIVKESVQEAVAEERKKILDNFPGWTWNIHNDKFVISCRELHIITLWKGSVKYLSIYLS